MDDGCFRRAVDVRPHAPATPATEAVEMIEPDFCARITDPACFTPYTTPQKRIRKAASAASPGVSRIDPPGPVRPALLTMQSSLPWRLTVSATSASTSRSSPTSARLVGDRGSKLRGEQRALVVLDVGRHHRRAFPEKLLHHAASDSARATGDDRDFAVKPAHAFRLPSPRQARSTMKILRRRGKVK